MTATCKLFAGVLLLAASLLASPAVAPNVLAGAAGLALLGTMTAASPMLAPVLPHQAAPVVHAVAAAPAPRVFELDQGAGVVVFREVDGKLVSRFYRASA